MRMRKIVPIVEGHGEEKAVPLLLRRWLRHRGFDKFFDVPDYAVNAKGCGKLKAAYNRVRHLGIEHYIKAAQGFHPDAIIVIIDSDDECYKRTPGNGLGPELLARARRFAPNLPLAVVVANPEYEAWFLASLTCIRAAGLLPKHSSRIRGILEPESSTGCKGLIEYILCCPYEETVHQLELTRGLTFSPRAKLRCPSYGKLLRDLERLCREARER